MQEKEAKFSKLIGKIIRDLRQNNPKKYVMFCDENDIANSTLNNIEQGLRSPKLYTVIRIVKALGLNLKDFGAILDEKLKDDFKNK